MPTLTKEECLELESMNITYDEMAKVCGYKMSPNNIAQCFIKYGIKHKTKVDYVLENVDFNEGSNLYLARKYKVSLSTIKRAKREKKMIKWNVTKVKGVSTFMISGHANFDEYGKDIVCASVSTLTTTTANIAYCLNYLLGFMNEETMIISLKYKTKNQKVISDVLESSLLSLSRQYPNNVKYVE